MDLQLTTTPKGDDQVVASYACPCGCTPRLKYERGTSHASDGCCCGNEFAVGPNATEHLQQGDASHLEVQQFQAPWGESIQAVWRITQTEDAGDHDHEHGHSHEHGHGPSADGRSTVDPVCGMTVDTARAVGAELHATYAGADYWFCGKGCLLEFGDDPARFLDPSYVKSM